MKTIFKTVKQILFLCEKKYSFLFVYTVTKQLFSDREKEDKENEESNQRPNQVKDFNNRGQLESFNLHTRSFISQ